jgi:hypothetical protein
VCVLAGWITHDAIFSFFRKLMTMLLDRVITQLPWPALWASSIYSNNILKISLLIL